MMPSPLKKSLLLASAVLLGAVMLESPLAKPRAKAAIQETVVVHANFQDCHDGDTCKVKNSEGLLMTLRLVGIDAPELAGRRKKGKAAPAGQAYGIEARDYLVQRVKGKSFDIKILGTDVYGRYLALILDPQLKNSSHSINEELVEQGFAFAYSGKASTAEMGEWAARAERTAKSHHAGLWGLSEPPEDPKIFRRENR